MADTMSTVSYSKSNVAAFNNKGFHNKSPINSQLPSVTDTFTRFILQRNDPNLTLYSSNYNVSRVIFVESIKNDRILGKLGPIYTGKLYHTRLTEFNKLVRLGIKLNYYLIRLIRPTISNVLLFLHDKDI